MKPVPLKDIAEFRVLFNRERYRQELAECIFRLMQDQGVTRTGLARLLGVTKGRVSQMLSGDINFQADTLADTLLVLGRAVHPTLGTDTDEVRTGVDEACELQQVSAFTVPALEESADGEEEDHEEKFRHRSVSGGWIPIRPDLTPDRDAAGTPDSMDRLHAVDTSEAAGMRHGNLILLSQAP